MDGEHSGREGAETAPGGMRPGEGPEGAAVPVDASPEAGIGPEGAGIVPADPVVVPLPEDGQEPGLGAADEGAGAVGEGQGMDATLGGREGAASVGPEVEATAVVAPPPGVGEVQGLDGLVAGGQSAGPEVRVERGREMDGVAAALAVEATAVVEPPPAVGEVQGLDGTLPGTAPEPPPVFVPGRTALVMAGLESGVMGAVVMMAWFLLDAWLERQYWWAMLNLWGAGVYQSRVLSMGLGVATLAGGATHIFLHGLAGVVWSLAGARIGNYWLQVVGAFVAAGVVYVVLMYGFWPVVAPVVERLSPRPATPLAYILFGAALSRSAHRARELSVVWKT
jgi:hypothetical protein